jgi:hypothetical protein
MGYLGGVPAPSSHCSTLIEIPSASHENDLSIAPVVKMDVTNLNYFENSTDNIANLSK